MGPDDGVYYEGSIPRKPDERFGVIIDTSQSVWGDMVRLGHFLAFALGVRASNDEMAADVDIVGADTVVSGKPLLYTDENIADAIKNGVPLNGGGGTDFTTPINQFLIWGDDNAIKYQGLIYITDFESAPPRREDLPADMPPILWVGMPHDHAKAEAFIKAVSSYSTVVVMEDGMKINFHEAQEKAAQTAGKGHQKITA